MQQRELKTDITEKLKDITPPKSGHQQRIERRKKERLTKKSK